MRWHRINALLLKYFYISKASYDRMFDVFYWPIIGMIVFGLTTMYIEKISQFPGIIVFLLGGMILWSIFERVQHDLTTYILEDFWSGNITNTFTTPLKESELFVGVSLIGLIRSFFTFAAIAILAFILYKFNIFNGGFYGLLFFIPLFLFAWALGILVAGVIFKFGMRIQVLAWSVAFLMQPIAAVFYPIDILPAFLQKVALYFPLVYVFEGFRSAYNGVFLFNSLLISILLAFLYMIIGFWIFVKCVKSSRKSGELTKY